MPKGPVDSPHVKGELHGLVRNARHPSQMVMSCCEKHRATSRVINPSPFSTGTTIEAMLRFCVKAFQCTPGRCHLLSGKSCILSPASMCPCPVWTHFFSCQPLGSAPGIPRPVSKLPACLSCSSLPAHAPPAHVSGEKTPCSCETVPCRKMLSNLLG